MAEGAQYVIQRIFNNNVVLVHEPLSNVEIILLGKGIGFGKKMGNTISGEHADIEKKFRLEDEKHIKQYRSLMNQVDQAVIGISEEIIALIAREIGPVVNEHVHVALPDHIHFAIQRLRNDLEIVNPFLFEIRTLYPKEFTLAQKASDMITANFPIPIPESEVGFLALHIHSAVSHIPVAKAVQFTNIINEMVGMIEKSISTKIERDSIDYVRLITHLRFAIERIRQKKSIKNPLLDRIKITLPDSFKLARQLSQHISERLDVLVPEDEIGYIAMHLFRLQNDK